MVLAAPIGAHTAGELLVGGVLVAGAGLLALHLAAKGVSASRDKVKSDLGDIFSL